MGNVVFLSTIYRAKNSVTVGEEKMPGSLYHRHMTQGGGGGDWRGFLERAAPDVS